MNSEHDTHDRVLVARYAAGDAYPSETDTARNLVDGCAECAALAADIRLISAQTHDLPTVRRPRDFRISAEQAHKLRGSWFDRLMRGLSSPGWGVARPLAGAAMAIGLALVVVGALPISNLAGGAAPEVNPNYGQTDAAVPSSVHVAAAPQTQTPGEPSAEDTSGRGPTSAGSPGSPGSPEFGATSTSVPGVDVTAPTFSGDLSAESEAPSVGLTPPPPPKAVESAAAATAAPTQGVAVIVPNAAPTPPPVPGTANQGNVPALSQTSLDRPVFVIGGFVVAFLALMILGLVTVARRRYSDPLVR